MTDYTPPATYKLTVKGLLAKAHRVGRNTNPRKRGQCVNYSTFSRQRLAELIRALDFKMVDFLTLTYNCDVDPWTAKRHLNSFLTSMKRKYPGLRYIWAQEFQGNGRIHFHLLLDVALRTKRLLVVDEYLDTLPDWPHGLAVVTKVDYAINLCNYLTSEVTKENQRHCHYLVGRWWGNSRGIVPSSVLLCGPHLRDDLRGVGVGHVDFGWSGNLSYDQTARRIKKILDNSCSNQ